MPKTILKAFMWASFGWDWIVSIQTIHEKFCNLHAMVLIMTAQVPQSPAIIQVCIKLSSHSNPYILTQQSFKVCRPKPFVAVRLKPNPTSHQLPRGKSISLFAKPRYLLCNKHLKFKDGTFFQINCNCAYITKWELKDLRGKTTITLYSNHLVLYMYTKQIP